MKRVINFTIIIFAVIIFLPLLIVKGCSSGVDDNSPGQQQAGIKIKVYINSQNVVKEMSLEEYVKGVVAAEMPADFEMEALKAQAVAARTYALGRMKRMYTSARDDSDKGADVCTDPGHCQAWVSKQQAMKKWKIFSAYRNWSKIESAVKSTENIVITYQGTIINPVFHSSSGGRTENSEDVWGGAAVPYLKSVPSSGEESSPDYKSTTSFKTSEFISKLKSEYPKIKLNSKDILKDIKVLNRTEGGGVNTIKVGNLTLKGTDFRALFSLNSTKFSIEKGSGDTLKITCIGNGHGVGMSQWGANSLAKNGGSYEEILKYYYTGINLGTIKSGAAPKPN